MKLPAVLRPFLVVGAALSAAGCGFVEDDPNRFEALAQRVADIRVSIEEPAPMVAGLRPIQTASVRAEAPSEASRLRLQVMDAHAFMEARDGPLGGLADRVVPAVAEAAAPVVAQAVVRQVESATGLRPVASGSDSIRRTIQIGAYSTEQAARAAWTRLSSGAAFNGLQPRFETADVNGKVLTRLKVAVPAAAARGVCQAAGVSDPWCASTARS